MVTFTEEILDGKLHFLCSGVMRLPRVKCKIISKWYFNVFIVNKTVTTSVDLNKDLETPTQMFSWEYHEFFKNSFFIEHLWWLFFILQMLVCRPISGKCPRIQIFHNKPKIFYIKINKIHNLQLLFNDPTV